MKAVIRVSCRNNRNRISKETIRLTIQNHFSFKQKIKDFSTMRDAPFGVKGPFLVLDVLGSGVQEYDFYNKLSVINTATTTTHAIKSSRASSSFQKFSHKRANLSEITCGWLLVSLSWFYLPT